MKVEVRAKREQRPLSCLLMLLADADADADAAAAFNVDEEEGARKRESILRRI